MKKTFKLTAAVLAGIICFPNMVLAADNDATEYIDNWSVVYNEPDSGQQATLPSYIATDKSTCYAKSDSDNAYTGNYSLKIANPREVKQNYTSLEILVNNTADISDGEYTIEFYVKGDFAENGISAGFGDNTHPRNGTFLMLNNSKFTTEDADNGWTKYSASYAYSEGDKVHFSITHGCGGIYLDDVSMYGADGVNLISNGGFETVEITRLEVGVPYAWGATYPVTTEDSYSGKASLKMSGIASGKEAVQGFDYDTSAEYKVTAYVKVETQFLWRWMTKLWMGSESGTVGNGVQHLGDTGWTYTETDKPGWYKYESTYIPGVDASKFFHIKSQSTTPAFTAWIDDISVVRADDPEQKNILVNGDFEDYTVQDAVVNGAEKTGYREAMLSWTNPNYNSQSLRLLIDGAEVPTDGADLSAGAENSVKISEIYSGEAYNVQLVYTVENLDMAYEDTVYIEETDNEISEITLNDGAETIVPGDNKVSVKIMNYNPDNMNAELIAAVKKGELVVYADSMAVSAIKCDEATAEVTVPVPDMADGDYTVSVYLWDSFPGMEILKPHKTFTE